MSKLRYPIVLIEWTDALTIKDNWHSLEKNLDDPAICMSVGYLVKDGDKVKILYAHIALEDEWSNECGKGNIIIPTSAIRSMRVLKKAA